MDPTLAEITNLGGVGAAIVAIVVVVREFLKTLEAQRKEFLSALAEQQKGYRDLEASVRANLTDQLAENSVLLSSTAKLLERVVNLLDKRTNV